MEIIQIILTGILALLTAGIFLLKKDTGSMKITIFGYLVIILCIISLILNVYNWHNKKYDDYKIRPDTITFTLIAERDMLRDMKYTFEVKDETLESFVTEYLYVAKNKADVEFGDRTIRKYTGYRSTPVMYFLYNGKNIKYENNQNPFSGQYIWDLNNKNIVMKVPTLLFGKLKPENWKFYLEVRILNKAHYRKSFDKTGKVEFSFNGLEKDIIIKDPKFFLLHDYDRDLSPENTIIIDEKDIQ